MRLRLWCGLGLLAVVLLAGTFAAAGNEGAEIEVLVYNNVQIAPLALDRAELEAARILRKAGVEATWVNCLSHPVFVEDACHPIPASNQFVVHIVPAGRTSTDLVFGLAFLDENGAGKYCDIFFNRIEDARSAFGVNLSRLLGTVAAHELGHLLLGSHAHSSIGIMTPHWEPETLRRMNMGGLLFTREQASRMQERIRHNDLRLAGFARRSQ